MIRPVIDEAFAPLYIERWFNAGRKEDLQDIQVLCGAGMPVDILHPLTQHTLLMEATRQALPALVYHLIALGADVNFYPLTRLPPVILASQAGDYISLRHLLEAKADVNISDGNGNSALHHICQQETVGEHTLACLEALLHHGAAHHPYNQDGASPLHYSVANNQLALSRHLLEAGACVNHPTRDSAMTALHIAMMEGYTAMADMLLSFGADPQLTNRHGHTPQDLSTQ